MKSSALHKQPKLSDNPTELRRRAELRLREQHPETEQFRTEADAQRLVHELEVHQIELEMQNEELKEAREELEALLEKYTDLYDFAPVGYLTLDHVGAIREGNLAVASLLGVERSLLKNRRFSLFVSPADRSVFDAFLKQEFESGSREECDVRLLVEDKPPIEVRLRANLFASRQACRVAVADITAHKRAEAATAQFAAMVQSSSDAIIGKDLNSVVTSWNAGAERIFGYSASEMVGCPISLLIPPDRQQEEDQIMSRIKQGESVEHFETVRVAKDGRLLDMSVAVSPIKHANGKIAGASAVARDITERKRAEADRLILNKLESTGILAGGIAHDFNNLFTVILLNLELAQMLNPPGSPGGIPGTATPPEAGNIIPRGEELANRLKTAKQTVLTARNLTAQLVTFAEGGAPIRKPVSLSGVIQEYVRTALAGSNVRCGFSLPGDLWMVEVDEGQIGQVLRNLALNAREAMPQGGVIFVGAENVVLSAKEQPSLPPGDHVRVSVTDRGGGIAKEVLPKIFDPYFSTKERAAQKGMGLGLTICHSIVQKHGGAIAVESELELGTTFQVYLPANRKLSGGKQTSIPARVPRFGRVLVMDDEEGVRKVIGLALWAMGHQVEVVEDGQKAVKAFKEAQRLGRPIDVVILDLTIRTGMGGQETIQALLNIDPTVKAIAMSGYLHNPVILEPERHGFKGALAKPFDVGKLQEILARVMGNAPGNQIAP